MAQQLVDADLQWLVNAHSRRDLISGMATHRREVISGMAINTYSHYLHLEGLRLESLEELLVRVGDERDGLVARAVRCLQHVAERDVH